MAGSGCEGINNKKAEHTKEKRALFLIERINEYNDVARATKDVRN